MLPAHGRRANFAVSRTIVTSFFRLRDSRTLSYELASRLTIGYILFELGVDFQEKEKEVRHKELRDRKVACTPKC